MTAKPSQCLQVYCPELFADPAFAAWLNAGRGSPAPDVGKIATWHRGGPPHEYSDVFVTYDHGDGSDSPQSAGGAVIPPHCWAQLVAVCAARGFTEGVLWLTNLEA